MRLVDADALCTHIENEFDGVCVYDVSGNEAAREFCDMVDIAPTIDAIPEGWLRRQGQRGSIIQLSATMLIKKWRQEQEAQDG